MPDQRKWMTVRDEAEALEIDVYGDIGDPWEDESPTAKQFLDLVRQAKGRPIDLHVDSGGGSVFDAFAMMTALQQHDAKVTAHVDGLAASAASFLVAAADEVRIAENAWMMVHRSSAFAHGNAGEIRKTADFLERIDAQIAQIYGKRSSEHDADYFSALMDSETWLSASEAVAAGLADVVDEPMQAAAMVSAEKLSDHAPEAVRARFAAPVTPSPQSDDDGEIPDRSQEGAADEADPRQEPRAARLEVIAGKVRKFTD